MGFVAVLQMYARKWQKLNNENVVTCDMTIKQHEVMTVLDNKFEYEGELEIVKFLPCLLSLKTYVDLFN